MMQRAVAMMTLLMLTGMMAMAQDDGCVAQGAAAVLLQDGFEFTEGPATAPDHSVVFSDVRASRRYCWIPGGQVSLLAEDTGGANGLFFGPGGDLVVCESAPGRITSIAPDGDVTVLASEYSGMRFNRPNDLWVAPDGGVYFSDPNYGGGELQQDGEHVYYIPPGGGEVLRIIDDMTRPNGLIGTRDGSTLYITDHGDNKTWRFSVGEDGMLSDRTLFVEYGGDGMTIDTEGNVYLATDTVRVFSPAGEMIEQIEVPVQPTNMCFAGEDLRTLLITARGSVFTVQMRAQGLEPYAADQ